MEKISKCSRVVFTSKNLLFIFLALFLGFFVVNGCGGSDSGSDIVTGQFKDANIAGLEYVSKNGSGVTGANGEFTCQMGEIVTFSVGAVKIGESLCKLVVTPVDVVEDGSSGSNKVQNIVRFLLMLDQDGNLSNSITISEGIRDAAEKWTDVDFNTSVDDFSDNLISIIAEADSVDYRNHSLLTADDAKEHLQKTLRCSYSGAYEGTFSGGDSGDFGVVVKSSDGNVGGFAYSSSAPGSSITLTGDTPIAYNQIVNFVSAIGIAGTGAEYRGRFTSVDAVSGTWENNNQSGFFSGSRISGDRYAKYRITGTYSGTLQNDDTVTGVFSFDIDDSNNFTGVGYGSSYKLGPSSGTASNSISEDPPILSVTTSDGITITGTLEDGGGFTGTHSDLATGELSGSWCRLN